MALYSYRRDTIAPDNRYDIPHPLRVDVNGKQINLAKEVETAIPGRKFILRCNAGKAVFHFEDDLTADEITILSRLVVEHKGNA